MKIAIHQPEFMPWTGFFNKMALADLYVIFDHVQFKKRYFENRNRLVTPSGDLLFLRIPVISKGRYTQAINEVQIDNTQKWKDKLLKTIHYNYKNALFFEKYYLEFCDLFHREYDLLLDINLEIINFFRRFLGIKTPIIFSSAIGVDQHKASDLILQICLKNNAHVYLCGQSGKNYLQIDDFKKNGIEIIWIDYKSPNYKQLCNEFVPYLSTLDLLFNHGENSLHILMGKI
jgi:hypothetical protein